ncbi:MAG: threonine/serine dehydratase [Anaerolineales bacterium]
MRVFDIAQVHAAFDLIEPYILRTPVLPFGDGMFGKAEHKQRTGSFKVRGALNKVLCLSADEQARGVVCASAGNHGLGVAYACSLQNVRCTVVVPEGAPRIKLEQIEANGAELIKVEGGYEQAERQGLSFAAAKGAVWISPYNDLDVIAGQGTIALDLREQLVEYQQNGLEVYVPASGGGLLCGLGLTLKQSGFKCRVIGVQTESAPYLYAHWQGSSVGTVEEAPTLADGLAGPVEKGSITLKLLKESADSMRLVTEGQIKDAMRWLAGRGEIVEPSAAVSVAAALAGGSSVPKVAILTGGNVDHGLWRKVTTR